MQIKKYTKLRSNKYKVLIDDIEVNLYDDVIIKYELLRKKEITEKEFKDIVEYNDSLESYYKALKYINIKLRTEKEIENYLNKIYPKRIIKETIKRLKDNGYLNKEYYLKCYIEDQVNLTNNGPLKIKKDLIKLGYSDIEVDAKLNNISNDIWLSKLENLIKKKINSNHNYSKYKLIQKIIYDLGAKGYYKWMIEDILKDVDIEVDNKVINKEYRKIYNKLSKKYTGNELDYQVKIKLLQKGFTNTEIEEIKKNEAF